MIRFPLFLMLSVTYLILATACYAEKKIKKADVPPKIISAIYKDYPGARRVSYYMDTQNDTLIYEVELTYNKEKLTLIFFSDGSLYELEKKVKFKSLPTETQKNIFFYLNKNYSRYKISEVQFVNPHLKIEYELNVKAKDETGFKFYDMYFNENGILLHRDEIIVKPIQTLF